MASPSWAGRITTISACACRVDVCNTNSTALTEYPLLVILDVLGSFYFAPGFTNELDTYLDLYPYFAPGETRINILNEFLWPENAGAASGIIWYAAILNQEFTAIVGDWDFWEFGWTGS